ncbi:hypothetical protein Hokovirus_3_9 [Hokovirus HKV1]|uniref:Uncharacterized protein n=1 Tax=Hokovirus HKV1 TaxID=1977638 RepID=A0A1V0SG80_9VIRU|nr:hypothetical protein Hokovirus_3_9 [Hokovirus HKV1]
MDKIHDLHVLFNQKIKEYKQQNNKNTNDNNLFFSKDAKYGLLYNFDKTTRTYNIIKKLDKILDDKCNVLYNFDKITNTCNTLKKAKKILNTLSLIFLICFVMFIINITYNIIYTTIITSILFVIFTIFISLFIAMLNMIIKTRMFLNYKFIKNNNEKKRQKYYKIIGYDKLEELIELLNK